MSVFRKCDVSCSEPSVESVFERRLVTSGPDSLGRLSCCVEDVPTVKLNSETLDPATFNPQSIVENGTFIKPSTLDYFSPSDPALVGDASSLVDSISKEISENVEK